MTLAHPIPATIDALVALWSAHPDLAYLDERGRRRRLEVTDGPPLTGSDEPRYLIVGIGSQTFASTGSPFAGAQAAESRAGFGHGGRRTIPVEVACQLAVWTGDTGMAVVRDTAFAAFEVLGATLAADRTLGGAADWARILRANYQPGQSESGAVALIDFAVQAEATRFEGV